MSGPVRAIFEARPQIHGRDRVFGVWGDIFSFSDPKRRLDDALAGKVTKKWILHDLRRTVATGMADRLAVAAARRRGHPEPLQRPQGRRRRRLQRAQYLAEKKQALERWADYVMALSRGAGRERRAVTRFTRYPHLVGESR